MNNNHTTEEKQSLAFEMPASLYERLQRCAEYMGETLESYLLQSIDGTCLATEDLIWEDDLESFTGLTEEEIRHLTKEARHAILEEAYRTGKVQRLRYLHERTEQVTINMTGELHDRLSHAVDFSGYTLDGWMDEVIEAACNMWEEEEETSKRSTEEREQIKECARQFVRSGA